MKRLKVRAALIYIFDIFSFNTLFNVEKYTVLQDKQAKRKVTRADEEKRLAQKKKEEEERRQREIGKYACARPFFLL